jgi:hypothetical protein
LGKVGKGRGYGQKFPFFYLPSFPIQTGEGAGRPWPAAAGGAPGAAATGDRGNGDGDEGESFSHSYLRLGCSGGADRRPAAG